MQRRGGVRTLAVRCEVPPTIRVALIGDFDAGVVAHQAIPRALALAAAAIEREVDARWCPTDRIGDATALADFDAFWCVPASPYRRADGALAAIRLAREGGAPFLGTCGGFQQAVLEYARNALGWADAQHAELDPTAERAVVVPLACSLVEVGEQVRLAPGSRIARAYGEGQVSEEYHCRYGINPDCADALLSGPLKASAWDASGQVRAVELEGPPFFVATLFQPERRALRGEVPPLAAALLVAATPRSGPSS